MRDDDAVDLEQAVFRSTSTSAISAQADPASLAQARPMPLPVRLVRGCQP